MERRGGCEGDRLLFWGSFEGQELHRAFAVSPSLLTAPPSALGLVVVPDTHAVPFAYLFHHYSPHGVGSLGTWVGNCHAQDQEPPGWVGRQDISVTKTPPFSSRNFFPALSLRSGGCAFLRRKRINSRQTRFLPRRTPPSHLEALLTRALFGRASPERLGPRWEGMIFNCIPP